MRRQGQILPDNEVFDIISRCTHGVLALSGDDGYPYALPISYAYFDGRIVFHSALDGHKIDAIKTSEKASFCIVSEDDVVPLEYTTRYRSVIAFGRVRIIEDDNLRHEYIKAIAEKYAPMDSSDHMEAEIIKSWRGFCIIEMEIEHVSGKESAALAKERKNTEI